MRFSAAARAAACEDPAGARQPLFHAGGDSRLAMGHKAGKGIVAGHKGGADTVYTLPVLVDEVAVIGQVKTEGAMSGPHKVQRGCKARVAVQNRLPGPAKGQQ